MSWPLSQDYNESIQDPRNSFADTELKTGEAVANPLGIPLPRSGNFADVYEVRCPAGSRWAVKCFTREVAGLRERYHEISKFLHQANLPFMVDFQYLEQGIRVRGGWYPILKMQWVEGFVLNEFVRDNLDKKPILQAMGQIWLRMARRLRDAKLAHCDLQHGNVLLVPGSTANSLAVKLIDYDGMCVPALAGKKSGEVGHPAFQHPERLKTGAYNQEVDRFSLLAIAAALRCLTVGGRSLWERYDNGDNLLFRHADLQAPAESPLFQELLEIADPQAQSLVKELFRACRGPLDKVPLLTDLMAEEKSASKGTTATATAKKSAGAQGADWDFNENESAPSVVKKTRAAGKTPKWIWAATAVLLLVVGLGVGLALREGPTKKEGPPVARNKPEAKKPNPTPKPPVPNEDRQPPPKDNRSLAINDKTNPPASAPLGPDVLKDAVLLMNFEKGTFYEKNGKTYVRDLSGHGNDGLCDNVAFTAEGKAGGGLACNGGSLRLKRSLINRLTNYTLTAWLRVENAEGSDRGIYVRAMEQLKGSNYWFWTDGGGGLGVNAWHQDHRPDNWVSASPNQSLIAKEQWVFVAAVLRNGSTSKGNLRLIVDDRVYDLQSQMTGGADEGSFDYLGVGMKAVLDEVTLSPRALSDSAIQAIRRRGIAGKPLQASTAPGDIAWDKPRNPDNDCKFQNVAGKLTITAPAGLHDLCVEGGRMNAPRVLRPVKGDFTAQVRVGGDFQPAVPPSQAGGGAFVGAGLHLWVDEKTYIRLERGAWLKGGQLDTHTNYELRQNGQPKFFGHGYFTPLTGKETYLRLERRGGKVLGFVSEDGDKWIDLKPIDIELPKAVQIGVHVISSSSTPFAPTFDQFQLKKGQGEMLCVPLPI